MARPAQFRRNVKRRRHPAAPECKGGSHSPHFSHSIRAQSCLRSRSVCPLARSMEALPLRCTTLAKGNLHASRSMLTLPMPLIRSMAFSENHALTLSAPQTPITSSPNLNRIAGQFDRRSRHVELAPSEPHGSRENPFSSYSPPNLRHTDDALSAQAAPRTSSCQAGSS